MQRSMKMIVLSILLISLAACNSPSTGEIPTIESTPTELIVSLTSTPSPSKAPPTSTVTAIPPTATVTPAPTATPTQAVENIGPFKGVASLAGIPVDLNGMVQLRALANGVIWVITSKEAVRWDGKAWKVALDGSNDVLAAADDGGLLWVLNQDISEISAWKNGDWFFYGAGRGWTGLEVFGQSWWAPTPWRVYSSAGGNLWVPTNEDVRVFDGDRWTIYSLKDMGFPIPDMEDIEIVHSLAMVNRGKEVWVGECYYSGPGPMGGGGVRWFDGQVWHGEEAPIGSTCISAMSVDNKGNVWLGAYDVIWRYDRVNETWTKYSLPEALLSDFNFTHPQQIIVDQTGDVWVIMEMCGGASCGIADYLYRIHEGEWSVVLQPENYSTSLKQLALDRKDQGWLFWEGNFYQLNDQPLEALASIPALGADVGPDGSLWTIASTGTDASLLVMAP